MRYCVLDFETTGLDPQKNALASVGIVVLDSELDFGMIQEYYTIINEPDKEIEEKALQINGLTREQLLQGKPIDIVLDEIRPILDGAIMVNHNSGFDVEWLNFRGFEILESIDTMNLSWKKWPALRAKLGIVCERFGIPVENAHNSLDDARMTSEVFRQFIFKHPEIEPLKPQPIKFKTYKNKNESEELFKDPGKRYIVVSGSRKYYNYIEFDKKIIEVLKDIKNILPNVKREDVTFVLGDANGVDKLGKLFAEKNNFPFKIFNANWNEYGDRAGMLRNEDMLFYAITNNGVKGTILVAFPAQDSIGTRGMINLVRSTSPKIKTYIFEI